MPLPENAQRLRIYIGESDRHDGKPLYEALVLLARELGLAGATVLRSPMGFGASSHLHTSKILRLSADLPVVVEIIDTAAQLKTLLARLDGMIGGGLVTLDDVRVLHYRSGKKDGK